MLAIFPELLFLAPFAAFAIRLALAVTLAYGGSHLLQSERTSIKVLAALALATAVLVAVGAFTQLAALIAALILSAQLFVAPHATPRSTIALALVMALSLVVTGPGVLAFDLPL